MENNSYLNATPKEYRASEILSEQLLNEVLRFAITVTIQKNSLMVDGKWYTIPKMRALFIQDLKTVESDTKIVIYVVKD
jgi:hypothetical protein